MKPLRRCRNKQNDRGRKVRQKVLVAALALMVSAQAATNAWAQDPEITPPDSFATTAVSDPMKEELLNIRTGAFVEVRLINDVKLRGRLGEVAETDFALRAIKNDRMTELRVPYDELRSVRILGRPQTRGRSFDTTVRHAQLFMQLVAGSILFGITAYATSSAW